MNATTAWESIPYHCASKLRGRVVHLGNAEVAQLHSVVIHKTHVCGLRVSVQNLAVMSMLCSEWTYVRVRQAVE